MGFYISVDSSAEKPTLGLANSSSSSMMGFVFTSKTPEFGAVFSGNCVLARSQGAATVTTKFLQRFPGIQGTLGVLKPGLCGWDLALQMWGNRTAPFHQQGRVSIENSTLGIYLFTFFSSFGPAESIFIWEDGVWGSGACS